MPSDITKCDLCLENVAAPKRLPCFHIFCLDCLRSHFKDVSREDTAQLCPVCDEEFQMPDDAAGLKDDPLLTRLAAVGGGSLEEPEECASQCEVCAEEEVDTEIPCATQYCVDCEQKLCDGCSRSHRRMKVTPHKVVDISQAARLQLTTSCNVHGDQLIRFRCLDCNQNGCKECLKVCLRSHNCQDIRVVSLEFSELLRGDISAITSRINDREKELQDIEETKRMFQQETVPEAKGVIVERIEFLKRLLDEQGRQLLQHVDEISTKAMLRMEAGACQMKKEVLRSRQFTNYCNLLISQGTPTEITTCIDAVHARTGKLLNTSHDDWTPHLRFLPVNVDDLIDEERNFIGAVQECSGKTNEPPRLRTAREKMLEQQLNQAVRQNEQLMTQLQDTKARLAEAKVHLENTRQSDELPGFDSRKKWTIS